MAFTTTDLDNVNAAIATGELRVEHNGRMVIYRSIAQLIEARSIIQGDIAAAANAAAATSGIRRGSYRVNFSTHRGD